MALGRAHGRCRLLYFAVVLQRGRRMGIELCRPQFYRAIHAGADFEALFGTTISNPAGSLSYQALFMLITVWVVKGGISDGIEKANRYLMPGLFILFIALAVRSLTLPDAMEACLSCSNPIGRTLKPIR